MDLYYEMLIHSIPNISAQLTEEEARKFQLKADAWVEMECYRAMSRIKAIIEDDSLRDNECFQKIEEIINVFEGLGSGCGTRHDYG